MTSKKKTHITNFLMLKSDQKEILAISLGKTEDMMKTLQ